MRSPLFCQAERRVFSKRAETAGAIAPGQMDEQMDAEAKLQKQVSLIICTVDRLPDLERCLASVRQVRPGLAEIIVVSNGSHRAAVEEIAGRHDAHVIGEPRRGVGRARNAGIRAAYGKFIAFLDDDAQAGKDWLAHLIEPFADSSVDCVWGVVRAENSADPLQRAFEQMACPPLPQAPTVFDARTGSDPFPLRMAMNGLTMNAAFRRDSFDRFGYFDTRFGRGTRIRSGEDTDLFLNLLRKGGRIVSAPRAVVFHRWPAERKLLGRSMFEAACGHTAILTKYFCAEPSLRPAILRYISARWHNRVAPRLQAPPSISQPRLPFLLGSLYGPFAFLFSREDRDKTTSGIPKT